MTAPADSVFRHLPDAYRRAGKETAAHALTAALEVSLEDLDRDARQLYMSRYLDYLADLDDAERLAALFELAPWPEEDLAEFQYRVRQMAQIYLQGAASAARLCQVLGAATDSKLTKVTPPGYDGYDRFTTAGEYARRADSSAGFTATVVDVPPILQSVAVDATSGYIWIVRNATYADPGDWDLDGNAPVPPTAPDPVVDIVAGPHPVVVPILVQSDLRRLVAVNRFIPPGATVRVDLRDMTITDVAGPHALTGPVRHDGEAVDLLFGTGGQADAHRLTQPGSGADKAVPFHVLYWNAQITRGSGAAVLTGPPGPPGSTAPVPDGPVAWPGLLPIGLSNWRLLTGATVGGAVPLLDETLDSGALRPMPATAATGPTQVIFRWIGRRLGTFTMRYPPEQFSDGAEPHGPMRHRSDWFRQQVERLKAAGVIYIDPTDPALNVDLPEPEDEPRPLALWEEMSSDSDHRIGIRETPRAQAFAEGIEPEDSVAVAVTKEA